ncbi:MAG: hypothetical protein GEV08_07740 [Acidimicrobiia bacterium]|nr:hypothetical protein [Acidimicrobiia bacterium]
MPGGGAARDGPVPAHAAVQRSGLARVSPRRGWQGRTQGRRLLGSPRLSQRRRRRRGWDQPPASPARGHHLPSRPPGISSPEQRPRTARGPGVLCEAAGRRGKRHRSTCTAVVPGRTTSTGAAPPTAPSAPPHPRRGPQPHRALLGPKTCHKCTSWGDRADLATARRLRCRRDRARLARARPWRREPAVGPADLWRPDAHARPARPRELGRSQPARHLHPADGGSEANVDPVERMRYEELGRIAEMHLADLTGLPVGTARVVPVNRTAWAHRALADHRPLFDRLSRSLGRSAAPEAADPAAADDPFGAMLGQMLQMVAPMMLGMTVGSMVGHLSRRAFGTYHLPLPRPAGAELQVVVPNVARFAEDWSIGADDIRLWVSLSELTHHSLLGVPHVRGRLDSLVGEYIDGFRPDASAIEERLGRLDVDALGDPAALQKLFGDPEIVLGAVRSPAQDALRPRLDGLVAVVVGWVDHVMDRAAGRLLGGDEGRLAEAVRRDRVEASDADRFVEKLLGLELSQPAYDRGAAFVDGVLERAGEAGLERLWESERTLPTPAEVDAPGLWLARLEIDE